jgi:hypothetical protein
VLTPVHLQVRAAGHAWTRAGIAGPPYAGGEGLQVPADQVLPVALPPGMPLRVEPAQRCALLVLAEQMAGPLRTEQIMHVQADAQGRAVLPLRREPAARDAWLVRALPDGQTTPVWTMPAFGDEGIQVDLRSRLVTVQVRDLRGGPPQGARAVVIPWTNRTLSDVPLLLDGAGRASIRLGAGGWLVLVAAGRTVAWRSLRPDDGDQAWTLDLQPMPLATVRLVDPTGAPAAWRSFPCSTTGSIRERNVPEPEATTILGARMRALWPEASDAEGLLRFPILVSAWTWFLSTAGGARIKLEVGTTIDVPVPAQ